MSRVQALLNAAELPLAVGNVLEPLEEMVEVLRTGRQLEKRLVYAAIRGWLARPTTAVTPAEHDRLREWLGGLREEEPFERERQGLLRRLDTVAGTPRPASGRANVLVVASQEFLGRRLGGVQPLQVRAVAGGGGLAVEWLTRDEQVSRAFTQSVWAAQEYLRRRGLGDPPGARLLDSYSFAGLFPDLPRELPIAGPSLGLGTALAIVSAVLGLPIAIDMAFTGRVDPGGAVLPVDDIPAKVQAAAGKGIREVLLPARNAADVPAKVAARLTVRPVVDLDAAVDAVFGAAVAGAVARLRESLVPRMTAQVRAFVLHDDPARETRRVLLTAVGSADPVGSHLDQHRRPIGKEEGPILTMARLTRPAAIHLFFTVAEEGGRNNYLPNATGVKRFLEAIDPLYGEHVHLHPLPDLSDPTDEEQLERIFAAKVLEVARAEASPGTTILINATSGTQQMYAMWRDLVRAGVVRGRLFQVREGRFVEAPGASRLREIVPKAWEPVDARPTGGQ